MTEFSTAVIGVGNEYRRDDGVGCAVATAVERLGLPGVRVTVTDGDPATILDGWSGAELAVIVDAVRRDPSTPGRIHRTGADLLPDGAPATSSHGFGIAEAIRLGEVLDRVPRRIVILAVEAGDIGFGPGLSTAVADAVPAITQAVLDELEVSVTGQPSIRTHST